LISEVKKKELIGATNAVKIISLNINKEFIAPKSDVILPLAKRWKRGMRKYVENASRCFNKPFAMIFHLMTKRSGSLSTVNFSSCRYYL